MALARNNATEMTKAGILTRTDRGLGGMLCFTPHTGLIYAVAEDDAPAVAHWMNGERDDPPDPIYHATLGIGWDTNTAKAEYPIPQLLPSIRNWPVVSSPDRPILVNWLITGRCPLACRYCYAEDLMRQDELEPSVEQVRQIAEAILAIDPIVVVFTGGDPLFTPHLATAIETLSGRVGLVVDTSGYTMRDDHVQLFKQHNVSLRISIDSQVPRIHEAQRPVSARYPKLVARGRTLEAAMDALCNCLDAGLSVTVQTVATKKTANDLVPLGDALFRLGVHSWRIFKVAPSVASFDGYTQLVGTHSDDGRAYKGKRSKGPYEHAFARVLLARTAQWRSQMAIQVTYNDSPNSVILVSPDGRFVTESNTGKGKVVLDQRSPRHPKLAAIRSIVDMSGHAARYLNMTTPFGAS